MAEGGGGAECGKRFLGAQKKILSFDSIGQDRAHWVSPDGGLIR
jgi:hypothetical protein